MKTYLLDTEVLVAWLWPRHRAHKLVGTWFLSQGFESWATCSLTEAGFIQTISDPRRVHTAVSPIEALAVLEKNKQLPGYHFWSVDHSVDSLLSPLKTNILGYKQVQSSLLLGLSIIKNGIFVTLDKNVDYIVDPVYAASILVLE